SPAPDQREFRCGTPLPSLRSRPFSTAISRPRPRSGSSSSRTTRVATASIGVLPPARAAGPQLRPPTAGPATSPRRRPTARSNATRSRAPFQAALVGGRSSSLSSAHADSADALDLPYRLPLRLRCPVAQASLTAVAHRLIFRHLARRAQRPPTHQGWLF